MVSTSKVQIIPQLNTLERDALVSPVDGTLIYNTDIGVNQTYNGSTWIDNSAGTLSLQTAYDGGSIINMDSNVNLEVFSSTSELAFSVIENGPSSGIQCNVFEQINPLTGGNLQYLINNTQPAINGNVSWEMSHTALNDAPNGFVYLKEEHITQNVAAGSETAEQKFYCAESGALQEYMRFAGNVSQINIYKTLDVKSNNIVAIQSLNGSGGFLDFGSPGELKLSTYGSNILNLESDAGINLTNITSGPMVIEHQAAGNKIDLNGPGLPGELNISSNGAGVIIQELTTGNSIGVTPISSGMFVNNGAIQIRNTDAAFDINISKENGGDINLDIQSGGGVVKVTNSNLDMNTNEIINQSNITFIDNAILENVNNGFSLRNSRDAAIDNIFIAPSENIFYKNINLQSGVNITFPFANNSIGEPTSGLLDNLWVKNINGLTPVGGLSSGTSNSAVLTASTAEQSILSLTFIGNRSAPANTFQQGDAYTVVLAGNFSSSNGDILTIRLKGGPTGATVLSTLVVPLNNSTNEYFELEIDFVIRQIGVATVADLAINYDFSYNQASGGNFQGQRLCQINNSTFDTTILNVLDVTAQFSSTSASNSIETLFSTLGKTF